MGAETAGLKALSAWWDGRLEEGEGQVTAGETLRVTSTPHASSSLSVVALGTAHRAFVDD